MALDRVEDRRREAVRAARSRPARTQAPVADMGEEVAITIRLAGTDDAHTLARLAQLETAAIPPEPVLIAEVDGEPRAAFSLRDGSTIANPFHLTEPLLELLAARADHLRAEQPIRAHRARRLVVRVLARVQ